ncbi:glycine zipper 2TM domain-containing protein [Candidatus Ferrigenium straubiae]|uniref:glycine zipper 2TM domain-containing protein n=1 Tax=Candidatus Ferrigenium straubiae TaxID=2919506 RepID=UPI003F4AB82C
MFNFGKATALLLAIAALAGCASGLSGSTYTRDQARQVEDVRMATVESVREVLIEGTKSGIGTAAGAVVGGIGGSNAGSGKGSSVGAVLGTVAGGVVGSAIEEGATRQSAMEITVKFDDGKLIAVTQAGDEKFQPGERVRVLTGSGVTRISH